jgi:hypothetical protein
VLAYFNNDWEGYAVENGLWLAARQSSQPTPSPSASSS